MALPSSSSSMITSVSRPTRPTLARLDTSERIKAYDTVSTAAAAVRARQQAALTLSITPTTNKRAQDAYAATLPTASTSFLAAEIAHLPRSHKSASKSQDSDGPKRRDSEPTADLTSSEEEDAYRRKPSPLSPPMRTLSISSGALTTATFEPSEIIKDFLFLGPDITTSSEARYLREQLGIRRVLNAAWEIESGGGKHLRLDDQDEEHGFDGYLKLPIKDTVEETGVQGFIEEACAFLDEARAERAPTYVHCKAGKSRSVMLVMAYLIHANGWSLQRSYAHVVEQRRDVSPNIGFVAELMAFEEKRRRPQESIGGSTPGHKVNDDQDSSALPPCNHVVEQDRLRESPPPIDSSADAGEITPLARSFASSTLE